MDISFSGGDLEFTNIKNLLKKKLIEYDVLFDISFLCQDDKRNIIGEEDIFIHPDFTKRFIPPLDLT